jgi:hypothetical protein
MEGARDLSGRSADIREAFDSGVIYFSAEMCSSSSISPLRARGCRLSNYNQSYNSSIYANTHIKVIIVCDVNVPIPHDV